jgi:hypothetical protein
MSMYSGVVLHDPAGRKVGNPHGLGFPMEPHQPEGSEHMVFDLCLHKAWNGLTAVAILCPRVSSHSPSSPQEAVGTNSKPL